MGTCRILLLDFAGRASVAEELKSILAANAPRAGIQYESLHDTAAADSICRSALRRPADACFFVPPRGSRSDASALLDRLADSAPALPILLVIDSQEQPEWDLLGRANDFIMTPLRPPEVISRLRRWTQFRGAEEADIAQIKEKIGLKQLVGSSPAFVATVKKVPAIARSDASVMILGETGTGKEVFARATHYLGARAAGPFLPVNCGAIPTELMENELFGHAAGAYTGATSAAAGLVKECDGGTLFLDEVDALPLPAQVKLLRFLQEKEFRSLGSHRTERTDVRVIAASNTNIQERVRNGQFRDDLFYRLNVLNLYLPPLRERREDIAELALHFLAKLRTRAAHVPRTISPTALQRLQMYSWPGNVRELENVLEGSAVFCAGDTIESSDLRLPRAPSSPQDESFQAQKARVIAQFEEGYIRRMLAANQNNITRAAEAAGKDRRSFWELMRKYNLHRTVSGAPATN
jgi:two-component system, NtrC family, response regulator GlrR